MRQHRASWKLVLFAVVLAAIIVFAATVQSGTSIDSTDVRIYRDGQVHVTQTLTLDSDAPQAQSTLLCVDVENLVVLDENQLPIDYDLDGENLLIYSFGASKAQIEYETNTCNQTAITERQRIQARQQTQLQIRNTTMLMNCTSNCEVVFSADNDVEPKNFQVDLDSNQTMKLEMNLSKSPLNGAMVNQRNLNFYLDIEPNATNQFRAQIRFYINQTELNQNLNREVNASRLAWMYWNQTTAQWEKVESHIDQNGYLVCETDHFSTWTVAEEVAYQETTAPSTEDNNILVVYVALGVALALGVVLVGVVAYKKRK